MFLFTRNIFDRNIESHLIAGFMINSAYIMMQTLAMLKGFH